MTEMTLSSLYDLSEKEIAELARLAIEAKEKAYCPYSDFRVGASLLLDDGHYSTGANVEVASTPVGICAERCAIAPVVASMKRPKLPVIRGLAVSTDIHPPASPCGMCRQFIREFCRPEMKIWMYGSEGSSKPVIRTIGDLLPMSFGPNDYNKNPRKDHGKGIERFG